MAITVHIACDDPSYRDTIESLLNEDDGIIVADKSREAAAGAAAVESSPSRCGDPSDPTSGERAPACSDVQGRWSDHKPLRGVLHPSRPSLSVQGGRN